MRKFITISDKESFECKLFEIKDGKIEDVGITNMPDNVNRKAIQMFKDTLKFIGSDAIFKEYYTYAYLKRDIATESEFHAIALIDRAKKVREYILEHYDDWEVDAVFSDDLDR